MARLLSEVPAYVSTAICTVGSLLLAHFFYVLFRDYETRVIVFGFIISGLVILIYHNVTFWRIDSITHLSGWIASALIPTLLVYGFLSTPDVNLRSGSFFTAAGEFRCDSLPDESQVCLNTNSVVRYVFSNTTRNVEVISGEASFVVQNDQRAFDVVSGNLLVHDISTAFDVYRKDNSTLVTVTSGRVRVATLDRESRRKFDLARAGSAWEKAPELHRLQQAQLDEDAGSLQLLGSLSEEQLSRLLAWKEGRIDLTGLTLAQATDELARYQAATRFRYSDLSLRQIPVAGSLEVGDLNDFLVLLEHEFHVRHTITQTDRETVITLSRSDRRSYVSH